LMPRALGRVPARGGEPLVGLLISLAIALLAVLLGDLSAVAPVVTMFFLTVYGTVNSVAAVESLSGDASWRPRWRVHWAVCLLGGSAPRHLRGADPLGAGAPGAAPDDAPQLAAAHSGLRRRGRAAPRSHPLRRLVQPGSRRGYGLRARGRRPSD
ncbi:MAG: hypothetical protein GF330_12885, partial [Candidatus Eisenbacteria bacterium]|nr:hypothetical protein [Candidatus Eisenbacteria bacterium]